MSKMHESLKNHPVIWGLGFISAVCIPLSTLFAIPVPRPVWKIEFDHVILISESKFIDLEQGQIDIKIEMLEDQAERATLKKYENLRMQHQLKRTNELVPSFYAEEAAAIETKLNRIDADLDSARDRSIKLRATPTLPEGK